MSKRLTRKRLDEIRKAYHMDMPLFGAMRVSDKSDAVYACNLHVEWLVNEIEALWKARRKKAKRVKV